MKNGTRWGWLVFFGLMTALPVWGAANPQWTTPIAPFRIAGNLYYVGSQDLAAYLIVTRAGNILINSNLTSSPRQIAASVKALGFNYKDTKILLISHAHYDHCAGSAGVIRETGAKYMVMDGDVPVVESGGSSDFAYGSDASTHYPATKVNRVLHDMDTVELGGTVLTAHKTAGHTRGTTTWTLDEVVGGKSLHVVIVGSPNVNPGYKLVGNSTYPEIATDYEHGFATMLALPCDIFLGAHGGYFDMRAKLKKRKAGAKGVFVDPAGYKAYITEREAAFKMELARQRGGG
jgi:metallo-beta-lactamase class B